MNKNRVFPVASTSQQTASDLCLMETAQFTPPDIGRDKTVHFRRIGATGRGRWDVILRVCYNLLALDILNLIRKVVAAMRSLATSTVTT